MVKVKGFGKNTVSDVSCGSTKKILKQTLKNNIKRLQKIVDIEQDGIMDYQATRQAIGDAYMQVLYAERDLRELKSKQKK